MTYVNIFIQYLIAYAHCTVVRHRNKMFRKDPLFGQLQCRLISEVTCRPTGSQSY